MSIYQSTKVIELGSCAFRQWRAGSHCKYLHGYRLYSKLWFECNELDQNNWVVDFGALNSLKEIFNKQFDHTLCIAIDDPLLEGFKSLHTAGGCDLRIMQAVGIEKTAEWCFDQAEKFVRTLTEGRCWVSKIEVWEHDKNSAIFSKNKNVQQAYANDMFANLQQSSAINQPPQNQVRDFLEQVQEETGVNVASVLKQAPIGNQPKPAPVGGSSTTGFSNLFGGTSWGM